MNRALLSVLCAASVFASSADAQSAALPASPQVEVLTVDMRSVPVVSLRVRATDPSGRYVAGLSRADLSARLLRDTLAITSVRTTSAADARPFVQLVIDVSGSMRPALTQLRAAAREFAERLGPSVPMGIVLAGDTAVIRLPVTTRLDSLLTMLPADARSRRTALWDAVQLGLRTGADSLPGRRYILVLSDGRDNASRTPLDSLLAAARDASTPIYTVAFGTTADTVALQRLASASGGEGVVARTGSLAEVLSRLGSSISAEHLVQLAIPPSAEAGWDSLFLTVRMPGQPQLSATWTAPLLLDAQRQVGGSRPPTRSGSWWGAFCVGGVAVVVAAARFAKRGWRRVATAMMAGGLWCVCWLFVASARRLLA